MDTHIQGANACTYKETHQDKILRATMGQPKGVGPCVCSSTASVVLLGQRDGNTSLKYPACG